MFSTDSLRRRILPTIILTPYHPEVSQVRTTWFVVGCRAVEVKQYLYKYFKAQTRTRCLMVGKAIASQWYFIGK